MKVHEFQAKQVLSRFGVAVPKGAVAETPAQARQIASDLGGRAVVKAQIHAGGRGKAGGVKLAATPAEAETIAKNLLGATLVTPQTGPEGRVVRRVLVEQTLEIEREYYFSVLVDRASAAPVLMASSEGGMEIEKVAAETPEKILRQRIDPAAGFSAFAARKLAFGLGIRRDAVGRAVALLSGLYRAFAETDASLVEVNPLVLTKQGETLAL